MRKTNYFKRWLALLVAAMFVILVVPGVTQAQTADTPQIHLQYASFDPLSGEPYVPSEQQMSADSIETRTYLLQFSGPVLEEWKTAVTQAGVRLYDYIPDYAFIARMDATAASKALELPYVRWVGLYHPAYRLSPSLGETRFMTSSAEPVLLNVQTLPDVDLEGLSAQVKVMGGRVVHSSTDSMSGYLRAFVPAGQVDALAAQDGVLWVESYVEMEMSNDVGGASIMGASSIRTSAGLYGSGQIVGVSDSGLDLGTTGTAMSDDFEGRIVEGQALCATFYNDPSNQRNSWSDINAHGTHVSGSVLGNGVLSGSNPASHIYTPSYAGVAPEAQIVFQSLDSDGDGGLECIPGDLSTHLFGSAYNLGARIHSNSWGGPSGNAANPYGVYTLQSRQVDSAAWNYNDLLILYAAGNDGSDGNRDGKVDPDSIGTPGTAKNALTVGATENERPSITTTWGDAWLLDFPANPIRDDRTANNPSGMAGFSSRGPTDDGRIKPDLAAPGTFIISARSHESGAGEGWGEVNDHYLYMGGTSMATPLTAGASALVREWLTSVKGFAAPSAALMKAVLVNGAVDMSPGQYSSPQEIPSQRPNNVSGWGRVSLVNSLSPPAPQTVYLADNTSGLKTGGSVTYSLNVGGVSSAEAFEQVAAVEAASAAVQVILEPKAETTPEPPSTDPRPVELKLDGRPVNRSADNRVAAPESPLADVSLVLDDGVHEYAYGVETESGNAAQFIWFNQFTPDPSEFPFDLEEVWILFDNYFADNNVHVGDAIDVAVYQDADGNPSNGANLLATYSGAIPVVDGTTWSRYNLPSPLKIDGPGDVYIAVINRYVNTGVTAKSYPAALDATSSKNRSWMGWWNGDPPDPPNLSTIGQLSVMSGADAGNWLIRGYGQTSGTVPPSPTPSETPPEEPPPAGNPLRVTLAWTDYPGSTTASKALVNDLDLEVIAPDGKHYYGNMGAYGSGSACLRDSKWDQCNNLEGVIIPGAAYGTYTIVVRGANVPSGPQPFALTATGDQLGIDAIAPAKITDLKAVTGSSSGAVDLSWKAPGDDGLTGDPASAYVIKYNKSPITSANWSASTTVADIPTPGPAGSSESLTVYGLKPGDTYYFAIKTLDEIPNVSAVSNSPSAQASTAPDIVPPAAITDLAAHPGLKIGDVLLSWTAPGDDERTGTAMAYTVHMSTTQITAANWLSATVVTDVPSPSLAGSRQVLTLTNMSLKQTYYFAIKARDEVPNVAGLSNVDSTVAEDKIKLFLPIALR